MKTLGLNVARTGLTEAEAEKLGKKTVVALSPAPDRSHFFPGGKYITIKLVVDEETRKVLGVQVVGPGDVVRRVDVVATLITFGGDLDDLAELDLCYAPPFATAMENLHHAANIIRNKLENLVEGIHPEEVRRKIASGDDFVIIDVRASEEIKKSALDDPRVMAVPLGEFRNRVNEAPRGKELVMICQLGQRAYECGCTLRGKGYENVKNMDGGLSFWNSTSPQGESPGDR